MLLVELRKGEIEVPPCQAGWFVRGCASYQGLGVGSPNDYGRHLAADLGDAPEIPSAHKC